MVEDKLTAEEYRAFKKAITGYGKTKVLCDKANLYRSHIKNIRDRRGKGTDVVLDRVREALYSLGYLISETETAA